MDVKFVATVRYRFKLIIMKSKLTTGLMLIYSTVLLGQQGNATYFQGFVDDLQGMHFGYHSPIPNVNTSLILRGQENYKPIAWKAASVPKDYKGKYISYLWVFAMDVTPYPVNFHLSVNDKRYVTFSNSTESSTGFITFPGNDGAALSFNVTMLDNSSDQMGFAILKVPAKAIKPETPAILKVEAEPEDNNAWYMTFKTSIKEEINIYQNRVVIKDKGKLFHSISADFIHVGEDVETTIDIGGTKTSALLRPGYNKVNINLPKVDKNTEFKAVIQKAGQEPELKIFTLSPVREWEIFLVQHTHSDIGYTRPQTEILPEHLRYIDHALDFCDQTDDYPDASKFRWTCETSWSVREYLRSRPKDTGRPFVDNGSGKVELKPQACFSISRKSLMNPHWRHRPKP